MGYELDTYFIEKAHKTSPRRLYSHTGADWQYRVDFERMRQERLQKTRDQQIEFMKKIVSLEREINLILLTL